MLDVSWRSGQGRFPLTFDFSRPTIVLSHVSITRRRGFMATRPHKFCSKYPCPNLALPGCPYCSEHLPPSNKQADTFYTSNRWKKLRDWYRARHPLCELCGQPTQTVHHIIELRDGGLEMAEDNLQALCLACHNRAHPRKGGPKVYGYKTRGDTVPVTVEQSCDSVAASKNHQNSFDVNRPCSAKKS